MIQIAEHLAYDWYVLSTMVPRQYIMKTGLCVVCALLLLLLHKKQVKVSLPATDPSIKITCSPCQESSLAQGTAQLRLLVAREKCLNIKFQQEQARLWPAYVHAWTITQVVNPRSFLYSPKHNITYCWNQKAGSTSISHIFSTLVNATFIAENNLYYRYKMFGITQYNTSFLSGSGCRMFSPPDLHLTSSLPFTPASSSPWWGIPSTGWSLPTGR